MPFHLGTAIVLGLLALAGYIALTVPDVGYEDDEDEEDTLGI